MPGVGPQLPPHFTEKRKRSENDDASDSRSDSSRSSRRDISSKRPRAIGPTLPPAPLDERPSTSPHSSPGPAARKKEDTSSEDDDFGPSLPTSTVALKPAPDPTPTPLAAAAYETSASSQRDAWMLVPPSNGDWSSRVDPTKLKARKFNTSKSASGRKDTSSTAADTWNETPQEKHARLQREMMGIKDPVSTPASASSRHTSKKDRTEDVNDVETRKRMKEYAAARGPSLYNAHQKKNTLEKPDDPSARAFDREKDIGGGLQINDTQRRDLLKKAGDFSSRFSSAKYL